MLKTSLILLIFTITISAAFSKGQPSWFPAEKCGDTEYNFEKESKVTERGNEGYEAYANRVKREECYKEWSVLVFMAGDNDLSPYSLWDIYEIERKIKAEKNLGASTESLDILVEVDTSKNDGIRRLHLFQTKKSFDKSLTVEDFKNKSVSEVDSPIVELIEDESAPQKEKLKDFLKWGVRKYPAKNYMVIVWGHGEGYIGKGLENKPSVEIPSESGVGESTFFKPEDISLGLNYPDFPQAFLGSKDEKVFGGVAFDYSEKSYIDIPSLKDILSDVNTNVLEGRKIDVLGFDACLMQSIEVAVELQDETNFIIGSTQIQNYLGLPYRKILDKLNQGDVSPYDLAKAIPKLSDDSFKDNGYQGQTDSGGYETFTASSISTSELKYQLMPALQEFSFHLGSYLKEEKSRKNELKFILSNSPTFEGETRDLGIFLGTVKQLLHKEKLKNGGESRKILKLRKSLNKTLSAINRTMMSYAYGPMYIESQGSIEEDYLLGFFKGLSIWLPRTKSQYHQRISEFEKSAFYNVLAPNIRLNTWKSWLDFVFKKPSLGLL